MSVSSDPIRDVWQADASDLFFMAQVSHAFAVLPFAFPDKEGAPRIWFPDYFCNGALAALRRSGAEIVFYPVDLDLRPDWAACAAMAEDRPPGVFVLVHYMGTRGDIETARAFCDATGARLLEDATQLLRPVGGIGSLGDFVCYSPRKFFDIPHGGLLVVRRAEDALRVEATLRTIPHRSPPTLKWRLRRIERALGSWLRPGRRRRKQLAPVRLADVRPEPQPFDEAFMGAVARDALARALRRGMADEIARRRLRYESIVRDYVEGRDDLSLPVKPANAVSCWIGVTCRDPARAQDALDDLRSHGFPTVPWPNQLPPETIERDGHERAVALRRTTFIVALPGRPADF